eukprot:587048-Pyramimonas_sp.AAC.1
MVAEREDLQGETVEGGRRNRRQDKTEWEVVGRREEMILRSYQALLGRDPHVAKPAVLAEVFLGDLHVEKVRVLAVDE